MTKSALHQNRYRNLQGKRSPLLTRLHFRALIRRVTTECQALRLWNWADHQDEPEPYFDMIDSELKRRGAATLA